MKIRALKLSNFRRIQNLELSFDQDFVILAGPNASGKTTVLESIYYAAVLQAFPPGKAWELIRFDQDFFRTSLQAENDLLLEFYYGKKSEKRFERSQTVNGARKKAGEAVGMLPVVTFLPQDLNLLQFSPAARRDYLDEILFQTTAGYENVLSEYARVLAQRNELLERILIGKAAEGELDFWDEKLSGLGSRITAWRQELCRFLGSGLRGVYRDLVGEELDCGLTYISAPSAASEAGMRELLERSRPADIASARTGPGPHRDDWKLVDALGRDLSRYLSRGEQRSVISALKLLELKRLEEVFGTPPVVLFDELLAELDPARRGSMLSHLPSLAQKFLTTTDMREVPEEISSSAQVIEFSR